MTGASEASSRTEQVRSTSSSKPYPGQLRVGRVRQVKCTDQAGGALGDGESAAVLGELLDRMG
jgi:hypothetical protein